MVSVQLLGNKAKEMKYRGRGSGGGVGGGMKNREGNEGERKGEEGGGSVSRILNARDTQQKCKILRQISVTVLQEEEKL